MTKILGRIKWGKIAPLLLISIVACGGTHLNQEIIAEELTNQEVYARRSITLETKSLTVRPKYVPKEQKVDPVSAEPETVVYEVPPIDTSFKTYTDYRCITDKTSAQWRIREQSHTDENGLRKVGDAYCIALGTYYGTNIGDVYLITLDTGVQFQGILADIKMDIHTDPSNRYIEKNGNLVEFHIDKNAVDPMILRMGTVSYLDQFKGSVVKIERIIGENECE